MLLYVTLTFYFKVKLFIIWTENILFHDMLLRLLQTSPPIKLTATIYWDIVESGIKHHKPKPYTKLIYHMLLYVTLTFYFKVKLFIISKENILFLDMLLWVLRSSPPKKLTATIYWNIVESGFKHHKPKPSIIHALIVIALSKY